ncbi:MAG: PorV/PorQ family protein [Bacteroidetes bacterium]|nr:PorV/PorQ family protein [Bacteroidota bacterium]
MKPKILQIISLIILITGPLIFAQSKNLSKVGTTAATFLEIGIGATANGMGGAYVSMANDATSLYWNVAGAAKLNQYEIDVVHTQWLAQTNLDYAALVLPLEDFGTLGFSFTSLSMPDEKVRTVDQPEGTGEYFSAGDIAVGISYARSFTDRFSVGFTAKYIEESIWHMSSSAFAIDAGTEFRTDLFGGMVIGASISNFGSSMKLQGIDTRTYSSVDPAQLGTNDQIPYSIDLDSWNLPLLFRIGVSTNAIKTDDFRWTVAVDALHPNDNYESMNVGTEFSYKEFLFLRAGYQSLFLVDGEGGLSFGVGLNSKMLFSSDIVKFDYAYRDFGRLNNVNVFSVSIKF